MNHIFLLVALYSFLLKSTYTDQVIIVEAEDFISQEKNDIRSWKVINAAYLNTNPGTYKGLSTASGGAYVEILPDTRVTHDDPLEVGVNFSNEPGVMGVLNYKVNILLGQKVVSDYNGVKEKISGHGIANNELKKSTAEFLN